MAVQKIGFFGMLHQIYGAVGTVASVVNRFANAADNLGKWAEEQTETFVDEARLDRMEKREIIEARIEENRKKRAAAALAAPTSVPAIEAAP